MNWLDVVIIIGLVWFTFTGLFVGLIREVISLAGLLVGVIIAGRFYPTGASYLSFIENQQIAQVLAFIAIFLVIVILAHVLGSALQRIASALLLGWANHLAGAVFGFVKAALIFEFVVIAFARFPMFGMGAAIDDSFLAPFFLESFPFLLNLLPAEFDAVRQFLT
jgi:membrane protein required for colicin V production